MVCVFFYVLLSRLQVSVVTTLLHVSDKVRAMLTSNIVSQTSYVLLKRSGVSIVPT